MCGRTIRIPGLDGTVEPLPKPKLDLEDQGLRDALHALASLEGQDVPVEQPSASVAVAAKPAVVTKPSPAPPPLAIPIEPVVHSLPPSVEIAPDSDPLMELAEPSPAPTAKASPTKVAMPSRNRGISGGILLISVLAAFLAGILVGFLWSRSGAGSSESVPTMPDSPDAQPVQPAGGAAQAAQPTAFSGQGLVGHVTYSGSNDQPMNDAGARILLLPVNFTGTTKIPVVGLRVGAGESDRQVSEAAIEAIGGVYLQADKTGHYTIPAKPGHYHLLIISRYAAREEGTPLSQEVQDLAGEFFDRPQILVGQVQYHYEQVALSGTGMSVDHHFGQLPNSQ